MTIDEVADKIRALFWAALVVIRTYDEKYGGSNGFADLAEHKIECLLKELRNASNA